MKTHIYDMLSTSNAITNLGAGKAYAISNLASLPAAFTADFTAVSLSAGSATNGPEKELANCKHVGIHILCTAKGAGFSALDVKVQASNTGGAAAGAWYDIPSATLVTLTDVGSGFIAIVNSGIKTAKFWRLVATATGGTAVYYAIAYGLSD